MRRVSSYYKRLRELQPPMWNERNKFCRTSVITAVGIKLRVVHWIGTYICTLRMAPSNSLPANWTRITLTQQICIRRGNAALRNVWRPDLLFTKHLLGPATRTCLTTVNKGTWHVKTGNHPLGEPLQQFWGAVTRTFAKEKVCLQRFPSTTQQWFVYCHGQQMTELDWHKWLHPTNARNETSPKPRVNMTTSLGIPR